MAGTRHSSKTNGHGPRMPRREKLIRREPNLVLTGQMGRPSWPKATPTVSLPRAITRRQAKAAERLRSLGGAAYLSPMRRRREDAA